MNLAYVSRVLAFVASFALFLCSASVGVAEIGSSGIVLVQAVGNDAGETNSSSLAFNTANNAGDLIAVAIRAGTSGETFTVTDSNHNTYRQAVQFDVTLDGDTLAIFYAENVAAGANTVTVYDSIADNLKFAIAEYSGVAGANSLDASAGTQGTGTSPNCGNIVTTANGDLLLAAIMTANNANFTPGSGFILRASVPVEPGTKLIIEDQIQSTAGTTGATAALGAPDAWGAVLAAFKPAASGGSTVPNISSVNPASAPVGASVTITGANFGATQGTSTLTFNGTAATPTSWSATSIVAPVPTGATTGNVMVNVGAVASNGVNFSVTTPSPNISNVNPASGAVGTPITIAGANFGVTQGSSTVTFNGSAATVSTWSANSISATVPSGATSGNVVVTVGGVVSNGLYFGVTTPAPNISSVSPTSGAVGTSVTIAGTNFGSAQGTSTLTFNGTPATVSAWSTNNISATVPAVATTGNVVVTVGGVASNGVYFSVATPAPNITSTNPTSGAVGTSVTIAGTNFGSAQGTSTLTFNGTVATPKSWSATSIVAPVPAGATAGNVVLTVGGVASNGVYFSVATAAPNITSMNPTSGAVGTSVTIVGANFGAAQGSSTVTFNSKPATVSAWSPNSISATVPAGATTGNVVVTVGGIASNALNFAVASTASGIVLVQRSGKDAGDANSASLAFSAANQSGNFIAVAIRAGTAGEVFTITDSNHNTYRKAAQFDVTVDGDTLAMFYAENIAAGPNTVTVSDTITDNLKFAIAEYSGVATANSLDSTAVAQGTSAYPASGNMVTAANGDLLLCAVMTANAATFTSGSGCKMEATVPAEPGTELALEDALLGASGATSVGARLGAVDKWGVVAGAFKAAAGDPAGGNAPPSITTLNPTAALTGDSVTITGTNFGDTQGTSSVTFNGTAAAPTNWSATTIVVSVPPGATTGNVVVTVGGVASKAVPFTVNSVSTPSITNLNPSSGVPGNSVTITGTNFGATEGTSTVTFNGTTATLTSWGATSIVVSVPAGATTGNVVVTVSGVASNGSLFTVTSTSSTMGPLVPAGTIQPGSNYFVVKGTTGPGIMLDGSHAWADYQDQGNNGATVPLDFNAFVTFLKSHNQNATILQKNDLFQYCGFGSGGVWIVASDANNSPWQRTGPGTASDGLAKFDLTKFNSAYFTQLHSRVQLLQQNGIYAIIELFDGHNLDSYRCGNSSPNGDGYPFTGVNNVNGSDDGYTGGSSGPNSMVGAANSQSALQISYMQQVVDAVNDLPNVLWEIDKEAPDDAWTRYMIDQLHAYEATKPNQHPVLYPALNGLPSDSNEINSNADLFAGSARVINGVNPCGTGTPTCKVNLNDSDHSYTMPGIKTDSALLNRNFVWENFVSGAGGIMFQDPYLMFWSANSRNLCDNGVPPAHGQCTVLDPHWEPLRNNLGYATLLSQKLDLLKMSPSAVASTGWCLADDSATGSDFVIYAPNGGGFTVDLSAQAGRTLNYQWLDPTTGTYSSIATVSGGNSTQSFTPPWGSSYDAVLYIVDAAGHN